MFIHKILIFSLYLSIAHSAILYCEYSNVENEKIGQVFQCRGRIAKDHKDDFKIYQVTQVPDGYTFDQVTQIYLHNQKLEQFPIDLDKAFPNLRAIIITKSKMKVLVAQDMKVFESLEYLDLSRNELEVIRDDVFKQNLNLEYIYLNRNKLVKVGKITFYNVHKLKEVNLEFNKWIDIKGESPEGVQAVREKLMLKGISDDLRDPDVVLEQNDAFYELIKSRASEAGFKDDDEEKDVIIESGNAPLVRINQVEETTTIVAEEPAKSDGQKNEEPSKVIITMWEMLMLRLKRYSKYFTGDNIDYVFSFDIRRFF